MRKIFLLPLLAALIIALDTCNDPVFYTISTEPPLIPPFIDGSPTNFAVYGIYDADNAVTNNFLFVASGRNLFTYGGDVNSPTWKINELLPPPGENIAQIARAGDYLYALCYESTPESAVIKRYDSKNDPNWTAITGDFGDYNLTRSIYSENDTLFIGMGKEENKNDSYGIFYIDAGGVLHTLTDTGPKALLCGVAYDGSDYFLCTKGHGTYGGIYQTNLSSVTQIPDSAGIEFTCIINLGNNNEIVAITRRGLLYKVSNGSVVKQDVYWGDRLSSGAIAVWREQSSSSEPVLLLAGRQDRLEYTVDSGYAYGYLELALSSSGISATNFVEPGGAPSTSTVKGNEWFRPSIGKHPINSIFQTPDDIDSEMTLFASTQLNGVWSLRVRDDGKIPKWNAETNDR